jgi:hypothetical protein
VQPGKTRKMRGGVWKQEGSLTVLTVLIKFGRLFWFSWGVSFFCLFLKNTTGDFGQSSLSIVMSEEIRLYRSVGDLGK